MKIDAVAGKILRILYEDGVKASRFIDAYRKKNSNIYETVNYFLKYRNLKFKYTGSEKDSWSKSHVGPGHKEMSYRGIIDFVEKNKVGLLEIGNDFYPKLLEQIYIPPPVLFFKGDMIKRMDFAVAIVGSRKCTLYGKEVASYISKSLSEMGITIVSGLASGIDSFAHRAALEEKGGSIGVLGCGIDVVYPPENKSLFREITGNGSIVTEFLPGAPPLKSNFPVRNRIISGLCSGVVVVEAGERSGALITGEIALKQNREVFAVPGNIFKDENRGCHRLIKQGAKLVDCIDDILEEFSQYRDKILSPDKKTGRIPGEKKNHDNDLSGDELKIYKIIGYRSKSVEEIVKYSGMELKDVLNTIVFLEMKELIREDSFNKYVRLF